MLGDRCQRSHSTRGMNRGLVRATGHLLVYLLLVGTLGVSRRNSCIIESTTGVTTEILSFIYLFIQVIPT